MFHNVQMPHYLIRVWLLVGAIVHSFYSSAWAVPSADRYEDAYDNVLNGDWYRDYNDDLGPYVANYQSYVLLSLAAMYRATNNPLYLDRLAYHVDGTLAQRNDRRGVTDYRGEESPCWRETWYSNGGYYCWTLHSGMTIEGPLQFAKLVRDAGLEDTVAYDGVRFGEKAQAYVAAAAETVDYHNQDWNTAGYYIIAEDTAPFLGREAGSILPMNMSNSMGIPLLLLHELTGESHYLEQASLLAARFYDGLVLTAGGSYAWTYYLDDVLDGGEDIGHAALSVRFAIACWHAGVLFTDTDMTRFAAIVDRVTVDDRTFWHALKGQTKTNYLDYEASLHEWLPLTPFDASIYATVRNLYALSYPASGVVGGNRLNGWAQLIEFQLPDCTASLVRDHWLEGLDGWHESTSNQSQILVESNNDCVVPLTIKSDGTVHISQDGQPTAVWQRTDGSLLRHLPVTSNGGTHIFTLEHDVAGTLQLWDLKIHEEEKQPIDTGHWTDTAFPEDTAHPTRDTGVSNTNDSTESDGNASDEVPTACGGCNTASRPSLSWLVGLLILGWRRKNGLLLGGFCVSLGCGSGDKTSGGQPLSFDSEPPQQLTDTNTNNRDSGDIDSSAPSDSGTQNDTGDTGLSDAYEPLQVIAVTTGKAHTCAILPDHSVKCWGSNASGQLEVPDHNFNQIEAGVYHTCGITTTDTIECWGWSAGMAYSPPAGQFNEAAGAYTHGVALNSDSGIQVWGESGVLLMGQAPDQAGLSDLSCGLLHCVVRDNEGYSITWGGPYYVHGDTNTTPLIDIDSGYYHSCGVTDSGTLQCWGYDTSGQLSSPNTGTFTHVSCGGAHCCALDAKGLTHCWGSDNAGQRTPPKTPFVRLSAGDSHTCGQTESGRLECWGNNAQGQCDVPTKGPS